MTFNLKHGRAIKQLKSETVKFSKFLPRTTPVDFSAGASCTR
jgi:hypothetical protein